MPMVTFMLAAFRFACGAGRCASRKLCAPGCSAHAGSAAHQKLDGGGACGGTVIVQSDAGGKRRRLALAKTRIGTCRAGQQTIETRLDAGFDTLRRLLRVVS
jgi:hypothetical protein